ncbi:MAG: transmembrane 220 family protein [Saprospiraceae bacterium]|nr:transmembrane 220 family protein [Saprospiraceae bacterium]
MKILNVLLALLLIYFAALQYNDPDPYIWIPIYLFPAAICGLAAVGKYYRQITLLGLLLLVGYTLFYIPDFIDWVKMGMPDIIYTAKSGRPYVELVREFGGLFICDMVLWWQLSRSKKV